MKMTAQGFAVIREDFGKLTKPQVSSIEAIVAEIDKDKSFSYPMAAYILATTWHETARTMLPIEEHGKGRSRSYGKWFKNSKGALYGQKNSAGDAYLYSECPHLFYGRGFVQLTWYDNYLKASEKLGVDFLYRPELVMTVENATQIMLLGMKEGWFTGKKLSNYFNQSLKDYTNARRIINGTDKAKLVAGYAAVFERALRRP